MIFGLGRNKPPSPPAVPRQTSTAEPPPPTPERSAREAATGPTRGQFSSDALIAWLNSQGDRADGRALGLDPERPEHRLPLQLLHRIQEMGYQPEVEGWEGAVHVLVSTADDETLTALNVLFLRAMHAGDITSF